jgi:hypothetical protein
MARETPSRHTACFGQIFVYNRHPAGYTSGHVYPSRRTVMSDTSGEKRPRPAPRYWLLSLALGLVVGFLGANSFADAAGFPQVGDGHVFLRVVCGIVIGLATLAFVQFLMRQVPLVVGVLARSPQRPVTAVSITLLVCGTLCVLGTLALEWHMASTPPAVVQSIDIPGMNMRGGGIDLGQLLGPVDAAPPRRPRPPHRGGLDCPWRLGQPEAGPHGGRGRRCQCRSSPAHDDWHPGQSGDTGRAIGS